MKIKIKSLCIIMSLACLALFSACNANSSEEENVGTNKPIIAVSIVPEQTFVRAVCGDLVDTVVMIPPGFSPENYEPTPRETEAFSKSALYFSIGVPTEETNILPLISDDTKLVSLAEVCRAEYDELSINGGRDPHIWLSPKRAKLMVTAIANEMSAFDPANAKAYSANAAAYNEKIDAADSEIREALSEITNPAFIVFHPAFGYFADEYGLSMYALENEGKEATAATLQSMTDLARREGIKVIFYQAEIDSSQSAAFAEEIGGTAVRLDPLAADYIENLKAMATAIAEGSPDGK
ncbi:MAG: zinc ABC transporter substrate-binding protein [Oscillospiraceae bacterium]